MTTLGLCRLRSLHFGDQAIVDFFRPLVGGAFAQGRDIGLEGRARCHGAELQPPVDLAADIDVGGAETIAGDKGPARHRALERVERSEEHTSELRSLMRISYAVFCLKKKKKQTTTHPHY